jgi:hypothetical protein
MNPDGSPAINNNNDKPNYATRDDLDFEMSQEEESAFVSEVLGTGVDFDKQPDKQDEPKTPDPTPEPITPDPVIPPTPDPVVEDKPIDPIKTDDLFIEVEKITLDELGDEKVEKIKLVYDPSNPKAFILDDFTAKNSKQLADILEAKSEMAKLYEGRKTEFDKVTSEKTQQISDKQRLDSWDAEIKDLIEAGLIEKPKLENTDPKYMEDPSVKKTEAVFEFMAKENEKRKETGMPLLYSFGTAFTLHSNIEAKEAEKVAKEKEIEDTKRKGALIGGGSSGVGGTETIYKSGSARNIWDVEVKD